MFNLFWWMIILSVGLLLLISYLVRKRKFIWAIGFLLLSLVAWYGYREYTRTNLDIAHVKADLRTSATELVKEFEINDSLANKKFLGKILEVDGIVKELRKDEAGFLTLVLGEPQNLSSVRCSLDSNHQQEAANLKTGTSVSVRGACTGFIKDELGLGSDVILNRCVVVSVNNLK